MAKVVGYDKTVYKRFTCHNCGAIIEYAPKEDQFTDKTDEGTKIRGLCCPGCGGKFS